MKCGTGSSQEKPRVVLIAIGIVSLGMDFRKTDKLGAAGAGRGWGGEAREMEGKEIQKTLSLGGEKLVEIFTSGPFRVVFRKSPPFAPTSTSKEEAGLPQAGRLHRTSKCSFQS